MARGGDATRRNRTDRDRERGGRGSGRGDQAGGRGDKGGRPPGSKSQPPQAVVEAQKPKEQTISAVPVIASAPSSSAWGIPLTESKVVIITFTNF